MKRVILSTLIAVAVFLPLWANAADSPRLFNAPSPAVAPTAAQVAAKGIQTKIPVTEKSVAAELPDLAPLTTVVTAAKPALAAPATAVATQAESYDWKVDVIKWLLGILTLLLTTLIPVLGRYLVKKYQLDISEQQEAAYERLAINFVQSMEEKANAAVKAGLPKMSGPAKENAVVKSIIDAANAMGLPQKGVEEIRAIVQSKLQETQ